MVLQHIRRTGEKSVPLSEVRGQSGTGLLRPGYMARVAGPLLPRQTERVGSSIQEVIEPQVQSVPPTTTKISERKPRAANAALTLFRTSSRMALALAPV
jgi:hypothetical protein